MKIEKLLNIKQFLLIAALASFAGIMTVGCSDDKKDEPQQKEENGDDDKDDNGDEWNGSTTTTPAIAPDFNSTIEPFDTSIRATDSYTPGDDNDIYWQANDFGYEVNVELNGNQATVTPSNSKGITIDVSGAHVAIDVTTETKTRINVTGTTSDGSIKIYSLAKTLLVLDNAEITSTKGPAVNCQSKKRLFIEIPEGSSSKLTDVAVYSNDHYYQSGSSASVEDRKGAVFAEGNVIVSGKGLLQIEAHYRHGLATDGMLRILPGTTLAVTSEGKNGIHAKGSTSQQKGIIIEGGYIYALCSGNAGKCLKSDTDIIIEGGTLSLNNSAPAVYDAEDEGTSSGAGIKSDTNVIISGGDITVKTTGDGAKGISAENDVEITGADITVTAKGVQYVHSNDSSSPTGIKAKNNIILGDASINVAMYGEDSSSDAFKATAGIEINGGKTYCYAYGSGLYSTTSLNITGGYVYSLSRKSESITSKQSILISGGTVLSYSPKVIYSSGQSILKISNATVIAAGGSAMTTIDSSTSCAKVFSSAKLSAYEPFAVASDGGTPLFAMQFLPAIEDMPLLIASPSFKSGTSWVYSQGGTISSTASSWNGYCSGASLNGATDSTSFSF